MYFSIKRTVKLVLVFTFSAIVLLTSCTKWLDIQPEGQIVQDEFWQNKTQAISVLSSCYRSLTEPDVMERMILWGEGRSDNLGRFNISSSSYDYDINTILAYDFSPSNQFTNWSPFYRTINYCNTFLYYAPSVLDRDKNFTVGELNALMAEAKTIRALCYFYLVRTFKRVPYITTPSIDDKQDYWVKQSAEEEVLNHITTELTEALNTIPTVYASNTENKGRITRNAVLAILADVYLWRNDYGNCVEACNQILADNSIKLVAQSTNRYNTIFGKGNSTESIFELQFGNTEDGQIYNNIVRSFYGEAGFIGNARLLFPDFLESGKEKSPFKLKVGSSTESEDDIRYKDFINQNYSSSGLFLIFKYAGYQRTESSNGTPSYYYITESPNWIVYRLPDVMLMKAEALVQRNTGDDLNKALDLVNGTYLRSNEKLQSDSLERNNYQSQYDMSQLVLRERQRELLFEGKRWFDLMRIARRNNSVLPILSVISQKFTEGSSQLSAESSMDALYLPVNKAELELNPNLEQNPYYKDASQ